MVCTNRAEEFKSYAFQQYSLYNPFLTNILKTQVNRKIHALVKVR